MNGERKSAGEHYLLDQAGEGIYAAIARDGGGAVGNAGLVDLGDSTLVIDSFMTPTAAEQLCADAQRLSGRFPRWVVNTHYHNDHIWGNQAFLPEAEIISTIETRKLIQTAGKEEYDDYRAVTEDRLKNLLAQQAAAKTVEERASFDLMIGIFSGLKADFPRLRVTLPNLVFESQMALHGSQREVVLVAFSGAHTGSDTVVYLPQDGIVYMSDLLFVGHHAYLGDGNPDRCLEVLGSILDGSAGIENASRFVPGHGPVGTAADVQRMADYILACRQTASSLLAEGKTSQAEISATPIPAAFAGWAMPRFFYANLRFLLEKYQNADKVSEGSMADRASHSFRP